MKLFKKKTIGTFSFNQNIITKLKKINDNRFIVDPRSYCHRLRFEGIISEEIVCFRRYFKYYLSLLSFLFFLSYLFFIFGKRRTGIY